MEIRLFVLLLCSFQETPCHIQVVQSRLFHPKAFSFLDLVPHLLQALLDGPNRAARCQDPEREEEKEGYPFLTTSVVSVRSGVFHRFLGPFCEYP